MKNSLAALCLALLFTACAGVHVKRTEIATGATNPRAIYIRPFDVTNARFAGRHSDSRGERPIRRSLAPMEFAMALKEEMSKLAPAMILQEDEDPTTGWLVDGYFEIVHAGSPKLRALVGHTGLGRSTVLIHVRITDVSREQIVAEAESKDASSISSEQRVVSTASGNVVYEFDISGGSGLMGPTGSIYAPGLGEATPFDFKNAAERIMMALSTDPHRYGVRTSPTIR